MASIVALIALIPLLFLPPSATSSQSSPWEVELSERVIASGASSTSSCVAAVTASFVVVLDPLGEPLWQSSMIEASV